MANSTLSYADRPDTIRVEGRKISVKFERTSPTTGRVSWNIPEPADGCDAGTRAYNGAVVTGSTYAANQTTSPINGQFYKADPTLDMDLHSGDQIGHAYVVAALYNDTHTTFLDVGGLDPSKAYYFSLYAVNNVLDYHREGSHGYSTRLDNADKYKTEGTPAIHGFEIGGVDFATLPSKPTGLVPNQNYSFKLTLGSKTHLVTVPGAHAQTYNQLLAALNIAVDKIDSPFIGPQAPNTGVLFFDGETLSRWNGASYTPISLLITSPTRPDQPEVDTYWFNESTNLLYRWDGTSWIETTYIIFGADPSDPSCGMYLFNGTQVFYYNGTAWCDVQTFVQTTNPFLSTTGECSTYWYNTLNYQLYKRAKDQWVHRSAVYLHLDPNNIPEDFHWFNTSAQTLNRRVGTSWVLESSVIVDEVGSSSVNNPTGGQYWYEPSTQTLRRRTLLNDDWLEIPVVTFERDPTVRLSCEDVWWESSTDTLYSWDELNNVWAEVGAFTIAEHDPSLGVTVDSDAVWYNPNTGLLYTWEGSCDPVSVIIWSGGDPRTLPDGTIWYNRDTDRFYLREAGSWSELVPTRFNAPPTQLPLGTFWHDGTNLYQWSGVEWIQVMVSSTSLIPENGYRWFNTIEEQLYEWNGNWIASSGLVNVGMYVHEDPVCTLCESDVNQLFEKNGLYFLTTARGSDQCLVIEDLTLFKSLNTIFTLLRNVTGGDGVDALPPYLQDGVGTDGSDEERKQLHRDIILSLGGDRVAVELSKESLDHSIDKAIRELRYRASPYKRGFFPIVVEQTGQKNFLLTNKKLGHNRVVRVMGVYRASGLWPSQPDAGINNFSQPWLYGMFSGLPQGDLLTYHLLASYIGELDVILARRVTYTFDERSRLLQLHTQTAKSEPLLVEAAVEISEQDIIMDRMFRPWVERWAVAESRMKLAEIRGKFQSLPGPGGGTQMNAQELEAKATAEFTQLLVDVDEFIVQDLTQFPGSLVVIG